MTVERHGQDHSAKSLILRKKRETEITVHCSFLHRNASCHSAHDRILNYREDLESYPMGEQDFHMK